MGEQQANFQKSRNWAVPGDNSDDLSNGVGGICNEWTNRITRLKVNDTKYLQIRFTFRTALIFGGNRSPGRLFPGHRLVPGPGHPGSVC